MVVAVKHEKGLKLFLRQKQEGKTSENVYMVGQHYE